MDQKKKNKPRSISCTKYINENNNINMFEQYPFIEQSVRKSLFSFKYMYLSIMSCNDNLYILMNVYM